MSYWKVIVPEATTNLCANPSFESGTTGWAASGTNTIAQSSSDAWSGAYSLKCTYQDNTTLASYAITLPTVSVDYTFTARVYLPSNWDGGAVSFAGANFTSSSESDTATCSMTGVWTKIETTMTADTDVTGNVTIVCASTPTAGRYIYVDAVQIEQKSYDTTYCDGDQEGCKWIGAAHGSKSSRPAYERAGGRELDLADDLYLTGVEAFGAGAPDVQHTAQSYAILPGDNYQSANVTGRTWGWTGAINVDGGVTLQDLHERRAALLDALGPFKVYPQQPVRIIYEGGSEPVYSDAHYSGGLEMSKFDGFVEKVEITFYSPYPFWIAVREDAQIINSEDTAVSRYWQRYIDRAWTTDLPSSGGRVWAICKARDGYVYLGGTFTNWDGIAEGDNIVRFDPSTETYSAMADGLNNEVRAIAEGPDGTIWVGGAFTADGAANPLRRIASWDGSAWSEPDTGFLDGTVHRLAFAPDATLYASGSFTRDGGDTTDIRRLATVTSAAIAEVGDGLDGTALYMAVGPLGEVYVAGTGITATNEGTPTTIHNIGKYYDGTWTDLLPSNPDGVGALYVDASGLLYSGHYQTDHLAGYCYNGVSWTLLGRGLWYQAGANPPVVINISQRGNGDLVFVGLFWHFGESTGRPTVTESAAVWNGYVWRQLDYDLDASSSFISGLWCEGEDIYIGHERNTTMYYPGLTTITNSGTAEAFPKIKFTSADYYSYLHTIYNATTGQETWLWYKLLDGETLTVDYKKKAITSNFYGDRIGDNPLPGTTFANWRLAPGQNIVRCWGQEIGGATLTAIATWHPVYKGCDGAAS